MKTPSTTMEQRQRRRRRHKRRSKIKEDIEPLSNFDIIKLAANLEIPHFNGVFMRDTLLKKTKGPAVQECWILNHGSSQTAGTHWSALVKNYGIAVYFDSFGKLPPPLEVVSYLGNDVQLYYNVKRYQKYGTSICGHLCLKFLHDFWQNEKKKKKYIKTRSPL